MTFHGAMLNADLLGASCHRPSRRCWRSWWGQAGRAGAPGGLSIDHGLPGGQRALLGGNLSMLGAMGLAEIDTQGCILFIEDVNEPLYRVDRLLTQLRLAGKLAGCGACWWGLCRDYHSGADAVAGGYLRAAGVPVLAGGAAGIVTRMCACRWGLGEAGQ
jgi:muramoyltetrapeptide carboxypeptidase